MSKPTTSGPERDTGLDSNNKTKGQGEEKTMAEPQENAADERATEAGYQ